MTSLMSVESDCDNDGQPEIATVAGVSIGLLVLTYFHS